MDWATDVSRRIRVGGEFARRRIDAKFRRYLKSIGWRSPQRTVVAFDEDRAGDVMHTVVAHWTGSPTLIFIPTPDAPYGYRFIWVEEGHPDDGVPTIDVSPDTSIGMLYAALHPCGEYIPADWSQPVRFERVPA